MTIDATLTDILDYWPTSNDQHPHQQATSIYILESKTETHE
jgi:hypothetical protein